MSIEAIIFDLDGTLINSVPDVRLALNHTLSFFGDRAITQDDIYELIGYGAGYMLKNAFAKLNIDANDAEYQEALARYLTYYQQHPVVDTKIYPSVVEVLTELRDMSSMRLAICTNKPSVMTHLVLEKLQLKSFFECILAGDEVTHPKPHGNHILEILQHMNVPIANAVMVGDAEVDRISAENAGVSFIGVSYGYASDQLKTQHIISDMSHLKINLESIVCARK